MSNNTILASAPLTATNYILKATGTALGQSLIWDNGTNVGIGNTNTSVAFEVTGEGKFYQSSTTSTAYLTVQNNRARNAAVYTATTNGGFYAGTSIGTDTFNYQIYDGVAGAARLTIASTGAATFSSKLYIPSFTAGGALYMQGTTGQTAARYWYLGNDVTNYGDLAFGVSAANSDASYSAKMTITSGGNVGIGMTPTYQLQLSTDSAAKPTSALWTIASDERIKENINPYKKGLQELLKINPITYDYNGLGGFVKGKGGVGIIAQEIIDILPDSVSSIKAKLNETDEDETNILNFNGHELIYVLINSIKEQQATITSLQDRLDKIENK